LELELENPGGGDGGNELQIFFCWKISQPRLSRPRSFRLFDFPLILPATQNKTAV